MSAFRKFAAVTIFVVTAAAWLGAASPALALKTITTDGVFISLDPRGGAVLGVARDTSGLIYGLQRSTVSVLSPEGEVVRSFAIPQSDVLAVTPSGDVFVGAINGDRAAHFANDGTARADLAARGLQALSTDPAGEIVVSDLDSFATFPSHARRVSVGGAALGLTVGPAGRDAYAPNGQRWVAGPAFARLYRPDGRLIAQLGEQCPELGGESNITCPSGAGGFAGGAPPSSMAPTVGGGLWTADAGANRIQVFNARHQLVASCGSVVGPQAVAAVLAVDDRSALVANGSTLTRIRIGGPSADCAKTTPSVSKVVVHARRGRAAILDYRISNAERATATLIRDERIACPVGTPTPRCYRSQEIRNIRLPARRGHHNVRIKSLPRGTLSIRLSAEGVQASTGSTMSPRFRSRH